MNLFVGGKRRQAIDIEFQTGHVGEALVLMLMGMVGIFVVMESFSRWWLFSTKRPTRTKAG